MPWTPGNYPPSMKNMEKRVRNKAVEIANALLEDGYEEGRAIAIATAQAKEWSDNHPEHAHNEGNEKRANLHVVPFDGQWAIKTEGDERPLHTSDLKEDAVKEAVKLASDRNCSAIVHRKDGTVETSHNYH